MPDDQRKAPPGWYDYDETRQAYWDGERWGQFRPKPATQPPPTSAARKQLFQGQKWPWIVGGIVVLFLGLVIIAALAGDPEENGNQERVEALEQDVDELTAENEELNNALNQARQQLDAAQSQEAQAERAADRQAKQAKQAAKEAAAEEAAAEEAAAEEQPAGGTVPDVVNERLDVGNKEVKAAGYDTRFVGGGLFGVVVLRNWVICDQEPAGGSSAPSGTKVDLIVKRRC